MKTASLKEWTYEEFMSLPEGGPFRTEIIDRELCMTPSPNTRHQRIISNIHFLFRAFLLRQPVGEIFLSPCDMVLSKDPLQVVDPNLLFVSTKHLSIITEENIHGSPDLPVEILSPSTESSDRRVKHSLYERFGVCEYWIVDLETQIVQVSRLVDGRYPTPLEFGLEDRLESPLLPGLSIPLSEGFPS